LIELWNKVLLDPMINGLLIMAKGFGDSFGLAIVALTIIINILILPLRLRQLQATKKMQTIQPKLQEIQKKYAKDRRKLQQETMKLYKESGINPVGCAFPLLIQFPIWIALYQSVIHTLATTPERLLGLSQHLYSSSLIQQAVPPQSHFLWMDLSRPDFPLALLVMGTMWVLQKMSTTPSPDPKQQQMSNMMLWMMPLMFGFIALSFPSGLALYWMVMNLIGIITQYFVMGGWGGLKPSTSLLTPKAKDKALASGKPVKGAKAGKGSSKKSR